MAALPAIVHGRGEGYALLGAVGPSLGAVGPSPGAPVPRARLRVDGRSAAEGAARAGSGVAGKGKTVHGEAANAGHRVLAPDDAEVEAYLETALNAPAPERAPTDAPAGGKRGVVAVLDFGSQFAQLIARRVRELNVYSELLPHDTPLEELERRGASAVILSGGPNSVYDDGAPKPDPAIWSGRLPVLGICYGAQLMASELGGRVQSTATREYGPATVTIGTEDGLFRGLDRSQPVWMSHGDSITALPEGFIATAQTDSTPFAGLADPSRRLYGIQFHPEVVHTPHGREVLRNFVVGLAGVIPNWTPASFIESTVAEIRASGALTSTPADPKLLQQVAREQEVPHLVPGGEITTTINAEIPFLERIANAIADMLEWIGEKLEKFLDWLLDLFPRSRPRRSSLRQCGCRP